MRMLIGTGAYRLGDSAEFAAQRMVNAYLELSPSGSVNQAHVKCAYGITTLASIGTGLMRGIGSVRNTLYVVSGNTAYRVGSDGSAIVIGTVPGIGPVVIKGDETNVAFLADRTIYAWNGTNIATVAGAPATEWLDVIDGYYVGSNADSGQFFVSANRDPRTWNALDFASAEKYPDNIVAGIVDHGELILFGNDSYEVFYNSGNADFPLDKVPSGHGEIGAMCARGAAKIDNGVYFIGSDGVVYRLQGYSPQRVSTHAIESAIKQSTDKNFIGFTWTEGGHKFYGLRSSTLCLVFDVATNEWHERNTHGSATWTVTNTATVYNRQYCIDGSSNKLGEFSPNVFTEFGNVMRALATLPPISDDNKRTAHDRLELVFEQGVGTLSTTNPRVMMRFSNDSGRTWSSEKWRDLGSFGEYRQRSVWHRLGTARNRIYEWSITDPVRRTLVMATVELEGAEY